MTHCEHCGTSDSDKEVRLSDTAPDTWLCQNCFELNPHHSDWDFLKKRPYNDNIEFPLGYNLVMSKEAIEHVIELLENNLNDSDLDLENNSISDIDGLREYFQRIVDEHTMGND